MIATGICSRVGGKLPLVLMLGVGPMAIGAYLVSRNDHTAPPVEQDESTSFTVSGTALSPPAPGTTVPIGLAVRNPHAFPITVTAMSVHVVGVVATDGDTARCDPTNFVLHQFTGHYGFVIHPGRSSSLRDLGFRKGQWPQLAMLNLNANQDACKSASITLSVTGTAGKVTS